MTCHHSVMGSALPRFKILSATEGTGERFPGGNSDDAGGWFGTDAFVLVAVLGSMLEASRGYSVWRNLDPHAVSALTDFGFTHIPAQ